VVGAPIVTMGRQDMMQFVRTERGPSRQVRL